MEQREVIEIFEKLEEMGIRVFQRGWILIRIEKYVLKKFRGNGIIIFKYLKGYFVEEELDIFNIVSIDRIQINEWELEGMMMYEQERRNFY